MHDLLSMKSGMTLFYHCPRTDELCASNIKQSSQCIDQLWYNLLQVQPILKLASALLPYLASEASHHIGLYQP